MIRSDTEKLSNFLFLCLLNVSSVLPFNEVTFVHVKIPLDYYVFIIRYVLDIKEEMAFRRNLIKI